MVRNSTITVTGLDLHQVNDLIQQANALATFKIYGFYVTLERIGYPDWMLEIDTDLLYDDQASSWEEQLLEGLGRRKEAVKHFNGALLDSSPQKQIITLEEAGWVGPNEKWRFTHENFPNIEVHWLPEKVPTGHWVSSS